MNKVVLAAVPEHHRLKDTGLVVDCFFLGDVVDCDGYILTHFHSDHYRGISSSHRPVYGTKLTLALAKRKFNLPSTSLHALNLHVWCELPKCRIMLVDANHCPGSAMVLCETSTGLRLLHTGDFRADCDWLLSMQEHFIGRAFDRVYLDTTYACPMYRFPPQGQAIRMAIDSLEHMLSGRWDKQVRFVPLKWLVAFCSYTIGKERLIIQSCSHLGRPIYVPRSRYETLQLYDDESISKHLCSDPSATNFHWVGMEVSSRQHAEGYFKEFGGQYSHMVVVNPTGWTFDPDEVEPKKYEWLNSTQNIAIINVPYSEHSSYTELCHFLDEIAYKEVMPTVGNDRSLCLQASFKPAQSLLDAWWQRSNSGKRGFSDC